jgi:hypothetical protein
MGVTANSIHQRLNQITELVMEIKQLISEMEIPDSTRPGEQHRPRTGYRFVRGSHSGTYVRDPDGTDRLPAGYSIPAG